MKVCGFDGCEIKMRSNGLCAGHYAQTRQGRELQPLHLNRQRKCSFPGCDRKHGAEDLCRPHYWQLRKHGPGQLKPLLDRSIKQCSHEGCDRRSRARGLCSPHYKQQAAGRIVGSIWSKKREHQHCTFPGCERRLMSAHLCQQHWKTQRRGRPLAPIADPGPMEQVFWSFVKKAEADECWTWTGRLDDKGYGRRGAPGVFAHRYSWQLHFGPIPPGLFVCHKCDNPPCVRPDHLFVGTCADNTRDMIEKGRKASKLSAGDVIDVRTLSAMGAKTSDLALEFDVTQVNIRAILRRQIWRHVP